MISNKDGFNHKWLLVTALLGVFAVAIGAIAAHTVQDPKAVAALEKAAIYQLIHTVVILVTLQLPGKFVRFSRYFFLFGIALFCGSIELKYLLGMTEATQFAPIGGVSLMVGWMVLGVSGFTQKINSN
jgi:uncharacterized membrane protein YgdD (TMEM256/DUF423 family)